MTADNYERVREAPRTNNGLEKSLSGDDVLTLYGDMRTNHRRHSHDSNEGQLDFGSPTALYGDDTWHGTHDLRSVDERQQNQQRRLFQGVRSGELSMDEFITLQKEQEKISALEGKLSADGSLDKDDRKQLHEMLNVQCKSIYEEKHDDQKFDPKDNNIPKYTPDVDQRQMRQQGRIYEGIRSGELTRSEFFHLEKGEENIAALEDKMRSGGLTADENRKLQHLLNEESHNIRTAKHNQDRAGSGSGGGSDDDTDSPSGGGDQPAGGGDQPPGGGDQPPGGDPPTTGDGHVIFGSWIKPGDQGVRTAKEAVLAMEAQTGRKLEMNNTYHKWGTMPDAELLRWEVERGTTPMVSWHGGDSTSIASGKYDDYIRSVAETLKSTPGDIMLRYGWEADGTGNKDWVQSGPAYIAAWRHIHDIFEQQGVDNVQWAWTPNAGAFEGDRGGAAQYYPGDDYVDWIGADGYNWNPQKPGAKPQSFGDIFNAGVEFAHAHGKPFVVGETGTAQNAADPNFNGQWLRDAQAWMKAHPDVQAFVYFDSNKEYDWLIDTPSEQAAFKQIANDPWFSRNAM